MSTCVVPPCPLIWSWRSGCSDFSSGRSAGWRPARTQSQTEPDDLLSSSPAASWETQEHRQYLAVRSRYNLTQKTEATLYSLSFWHLHTEYQYFTWVPGFAATLGADRHPPPATCHINLHHWHFMGNHGFYEPSVVCPINHRDICMRMYIHWHMHVRVCACGNRWMDGWNKMWVKH